MSDMKPSTLSTVFSETPVSSCPREKTNKIFINRTLSLFDAKDTNGKSLEILIFQEKKNRSMNRDSTKLPVMFEEFYSDWTPSDIVESIERHCN